MLSTRIPEQQYESLQAYAGLARRSMNSVIVEALGEFLDERTGESIEALIAATRAKFGPTIDRAREL